MAKKSKTEKPVTVPAKLEKLYVETRMIKHPDLICLLKKTDGTWDTAPIHGWHSRTKWYSNDAIITDIQAVIIYEGHVIGHLDIIDSLFFPISATEIVVASQLNNPTFLSLYPGIEPLEK